MMVITHVPKRHLRFMIWVPKGPNARKRIVWVTQIHTNLILGR